MRELSVPLTKAGGIGPHNLHSPAIRDRVGGSVYAAAKLGREGQDSISMARAFAPILLCFLGLLGIMEHESPVAFCFLEQRFHDEPGGVLEPGKKKPW